MLQAKQMSCYRCLRVLQHLPRPLLRDSFRQAQKQPLESVLAGAWIQEVSRSRPIREYVPICLFGQYMLNCNRVNLFMIPMEKPRSDSLHAERPTGRLIDEKERRGKGILTDVLSNSCCAYIPFRISHTLAHRLLACHHSGESLRLHVSPELLTCCQQVGPVPYHRLRPTRQPRQRILHMCKAHFLIRPSQKRILL